MKEFNESGIVFYFDKSKWEITQFDKERDYLKVSSALKETKSVDFIGIHENESIYFFEIKSFRGYSINKSVKERTQNGAEDLTTEIAQKVRDSLACLLAGAHNSTHNSAFWAKLCDIIRDEEKTPVKVIAWIEEDRKKKTAKEKKAELSIRTSKLKKKLGWLSRRIYVVDIAESNFIPDFNVRLSS